MGSPGVPTGPRGPLWWPGRRRKNTLLVSPETIRSTASIVAPAAESAALNDCEHTAVSPSMVPIARGAMRMSGNLSQILCTFLRYAYSCHSKHVHPCRGLDLGDVFHVKALEIFTSKRAVRLVQ